MRSRIATIVTALALLGGTGGAIAVGASGSPGGAQGGAASGQYKPGKGCGDKNHKHKKQNQCKAPKKHKKAKKHRRATNKTKPKHKAKPNQNRGFHCVTGKIGGYVVTSCSYS